MFLETVQPRISLHIWKIGKRVREGCLGDSPGYVTDSEAKLLKRQDKDTLL